jgi:hypothetical protein
LLFKKINIIKCGTVIVLVVLYGCETWSLTWREESRLRLLRKMFGPKKEEVSGDWRSSMICTPHPTLFGDKIKEN